MLFISSKVIMACVAAARSAHPYESILLIHGRRDEKGIKLLSTSIPSGLSASLSSASFLPWLTPLHPDYLGIFHSHPNSCNSPSKQDLLFASKVGGVQLLLAFPYNPSDLVAYDLNGRKIEYKIID